MDGILIVDKPAGPTSARVVAAVRKRLAVRKIGHTGTLDPMATGVLPMCIGRATKIAGLLSADDKEYSGEITFGIETDTLDREGAIVCVDHVGARALERVTVEAALETMTGELEQVPPMYSALRSGGVRLHELARAGKTIERAARPIRVDSFVLISFVAGDGDAPPRARFSVACSKGTYVRSLVRDLGRALGCGAHLHSLRRTRAGAFDLQNALALADVTAEAALRQMIPIAAALAHLPSVTVEHELLARVLSGLQLRWPQVSQKQPPEQRFCILAPGGELLAIARVEGGLLAYDRVFPQEPL